MIYAGIGARDTPPLALDQMQTIARFMASHGHVLRSGGAKGADTAFETGCDEKGGKKEIYLPHQRFNGNESPLWRVTMEARQIAKAFHPNWPVLGDRGRDFMGRNAYQILGLDLNTPAHCVICWTPNGKTVGGTGQALRMAAHFNIPVVNLAARSQEEISDRIMEILETAP